MTQSEAQIEVREIIIREFTIRSGSRLYIKSTPEDTALIENSFAEVCRNLLWEIQDLGLGEDEVQRMARWIVGGLGERPKR